MRVIIWSHTLNLQSPSQLKTKPKASRPDSYVVFTRGRNLSDATDIYKGRASPREKTHLWWWSGQSSGVFSKTSVIGILNPLCAWIANSNGQQPGNNRLLQHWLQLVLKSYDTTDHCMGFSCYGNSQLGPK